MQTGAGIRFVDRKQTENQKMIRDRRHKRKMENTRGRVGNRRVKRKGKRSIRGTGEKEGRTEVKQEKKTQQEKQKWEK